MFVLTIQSSGDLKVVSVTLLCFEYEGVNTERYLPVSISPRQLQSGFGVRMSFRIARVRKVSKTPPRGRQVQSSVHFIHM